MAQRPGDWRRSSVNVLIKGDARPSYSFCLICFSNVPAGLMGSCTGLLLYRCFVFGDCPRVVLLALESNTVKTPVTEDWMLRSLLQRSSRSVGSLGSFDSFGSFTLGCGNFTEPIIGTEFCLGLCGLEKIPHSMALIERCKP